LTVWAPPLLHTVEPSTVTAIERVSAPVVGSDAVAVYSVFWLF
jgi:hypothetical protein